ncbi:MAG TPA: polysaccharide deacetylase [Candidatus Limivivens intestinipullorum]|uniref:Polysaccharide deacetylase n=1 Tax=Candidatus Limivivens intestinipullorum TaxID=2840858 RepID=A0A9D1EWQ7_9FIRM|nr:polysaccharide deacetylase [Candidatus Limivivens intestinipullorum]
MDYSERQRRQELRRKKRKRQVLIGKILIVLMLVILIALAVILIRDVAGKSLGGQGNTGSRPPAQSSEGQTAGGGQPETGDSVEAGTSVETENSGETEAPAGSSQEQLIAEADRMAAQYDYDRAISHLKESGMYDSSTAMQTAVAGYEESKAACVEYPLEEVTHVFYHTLIYDTSKAFDGDNKSGNYNQVMTTVSEFNKITQEMYDRGYVLVSLHDMCTVNEDGTVSRGSIYLPPGKKAFVLSQDDVCYYHYMEGDGMATKLVLDENGNVKNEYKNDDGTVSIGDYDLVPILDTFIDEHPDFSYRGAKGTIALTGYDGILGYRTDICYKTRENLQPDQQKFLDDNPDFDEAAWEKDREDAKKVAEAMMADGWDFASHTWGHMNVGERDLAAIQSDTVKWQENVEPLIGKTNIIIFAFGADIGSWEGYGSDNEKFTYLKSQGFDIYCNVDSTKYWVQFGSNYMRQGRRNLDGYRMYYSPELVTDLFDVSAVWDSSRPTPVPQM